MLKSKEIVKIAKDIVEHLTTVYAKGGCGQYITQSQYDALRNQYQWNKDHFDQSWLGKYATDCVCWIKGVLWGWTFEDPYSRAKYATNGVPDFTVEQMERDLKDCVPPAKAKEGYLLWKPGHAGMCIGNGLAIDSNYEVSGNKVTVNGMIIRKISDIKWEKAGKSPYIDYSDQDTVNIGDVIPMKVTKIENGIAYGSVKIEEPVSPVIKVGSRVTIDPGSKAGGANTKYRGLYIDSKYANGKFIDTVTKIETHFGVEEALLKTLVTWVALDSLNPV